ncbi:ROK family protein [Corynebacterium sp. CCM 8835]|uniref:ROK family protein n=1 Tax=Corynebacterium antarcticum TaxID=2800405 RepID=A0A9Q4CAB1_9CORY|nr:ROK family protein [Corynebacterium antarcticum]MCK7641647.1 ROK family protein [Corynebacterium antarcticum]MCK7660255.1 ROK family protein [Corynebacterium antarcticum]MCL0244875.1 ROK family protein [Corynebacterium antarcticum]MCX7537273.1 ROK family protein [Corynebacterium antarcticum]MCX7539569.1 ROK family protein [Corynebacterium antarcticum]
MSATTREENTRTPWALGIDVGGTAIKAAVVDPSGDTHHQLNIPTPTDPRRLADTAAGAATELTGWARSNGVDLVDTVGVNIPGIIDEVRGISVFSANLGWRNEPIAGMLEEALRRPVTLGHDVRSGAFAESRWGVAYPDFFFLAIGTGISSVVISGHQPTTTWQWAGEIGQVLVPGYDGDLVPLEHVCSAAGIGRRGASLGLVPEGSGSREVFELVDQGDGRATEITDFACETLGRFLAPVVATLGPIPIVISGGMVARGEKLLAPIREALTRYLGVVPAPGRIESAKLGIDAQVRGAALRAFDSSGCEIRPRAADTGTHPSP